MQVKRLDLANRRDVQRYIDFPFRLYRESSLWVPPFVRDMWMQLNPRRHPFYEHSEAAFFLAQRDGEVVGRVAVLDNARYNEYQGERTAFFYHFDSVDDRAVSRVLFDAAFDWARGRGLDRMWGPQGFLAVDGRGVLVEGFDHRPAMGIPYNYPYYSALLEGVGFEKQLDFVSAYIDRGMSLPKRFLSVADKVKRRGGFRSVRFRTKDEIRAWIPRVTAVYNESFVDVQGYVPITEAEAKVIGERILAVADPSLITLLMKGHELVGFVLAYPDLSAAIQRCRGRLWPLGWLYLMREFKRTRWVDFNGIAILESHRGLGGNAMLYAELYHAIMEGSQYHCGELVQIQETNTRMVRELEAVGVKLYKKHRIYRRSLN